MADNQYDDELSGVLFPNDKRGNDKAPDVTGKATIEGVEYRVAGWKRVSNNTGKRFFSLKFENAEERERALAEADEGDALEI
jgi:uncharacterized protein (DUF736 family)